MAWRFPSWSASGCLAFPQGARILDVCCGTGYLAGLLAARGYRVTGIDASAAMIGFARETAPEAEFSVADAARFHPAVPTSTRPFPLSTA